MRRDKTLKVCANHFITPWMELKPNAGSQKAFVYKVFADFADEKPKSECLAIKFGTIESECFHDVHYQFIITIIGILRSIHSNVAISI